MATPESSGNGGTHMALIVGWERSALFHLMFSAQPPAKQRFHAPPPFHAWIFLVTRSINSSSRKAWTLASTSSSQTPRTVVRRCTAVRNSCT